MPQFKFRFFEIFHSTLFSEKSVLSGLFIDCLDQNFVQLNLTIALDASRDIKNNVLEKKFLKCLKINEKYQLLHRVIYSILQKNSRDLMDSGVIFHFK